MVRFNHCGLSCAAFYHIWVNGSLTKQLNLPQFHCLSLKYSDELFSNDLSLSLRIGNSRQLVQEPASGVDSDQVHVEFLPKNLFYQVPLILTQQAMVHKNACQIFPDSPVYQHSRHGGIHPAGKPAKHLSAADALFQGLYCLLSKGVHFPIPCTTTHYI